MHFIHLPHSRFNHHQSIPPVMLSARERKTSVGALASVLPTLTNKQSNVGFVNDLGRTLGLQSCFWPLLVLNTQLRGFAPREPTCSKCTLMFPLPLFLSTQRRMCNTCCKPVPFSSTIFPAAAPPVRKSNNRWILVCRSANTLFL